MIGASAELDSLQAGLAGCDAVVCCGDTVVSCDTDTAVRVGDVSVYGRGEVDVCVVDTVVSSFDESVCGVQTAMTAGELDVGVDTVVSGVDKSVCGVHTVMTVGERDVCVVDTVVSVVDESVCGVQTVMTVGELDVGVFDTVVSDEAGESSEMMLESDDDVVCGDDPLLVRVGDFVSGC